MIKKRVTQIMKRKSVYVDEFFNQALTWKKEMQALRKVTLKCNKLNEEFKWKQPCYTYEEKNICIIGAFKKYCVLSFFKGSLITDTQGILEAPGPNSQASRQIRFTDVNEIFDLQTTIIAYIEQAITIEEQGQKVDFKKERPTIPVELQNKFKKLKSFQKAFDELTPGRQKAYLLFFLSAKSSETRQRRIEKYSQRILQGKGMNDCVCGLSKKMPQCDGSHKFK